MHVVGRHNDSLDRDEVGMKITKKYYEKHIPKCCRLKTYKEHAEQLMLCWGLVRDLEEGKNQTRCDRVCDMHIHYDPKLLKKS